jgi:hypothetical protein
MKCTDNYYDTFNLVYFDILTWIILIIYPGLFYFFNQVCFDIFT